MEIEATWKKDYDLETLWQERAQALDKHFEHKEKFEKLDPDIQEAIGSLLDVAFLTLAQDKSWIAGNIEIDEGKCVDFHIRFLYSEISNEVIRRREQEQRALIQMKQETHEMLDDLGEETADAQ